MNISLLNGEAGTLPVSHRALAYGDGLFETIYVDQQGPHFLSQHLERLARGIKRLQLNYSEAQLAELHDSLTHLCKNLQSPHVLKVMVLRQSAGRGYDFVPTEQLSDTVIQLSDYSKPAWAEQGACVMVSDIPVTESTALVGLKHLNRLDSVLARQTARQLGADEVLMLDAKQHIIQGTMTNVFFKIHGKWQTPLLKKAGVEGIYKQSLMQRYDIEERDIDVAVLDDIESAFITNSLIGIVPISELQGRALLVCSDLTSE
ncbi:aminodeoxychorismate lyase [Reinekea thalattae]|uniref:Aminodeoxychorismate lyase n=1 Tax=Reinekea thalattae TaxID=2593301 RepID=A0A5C8Z875_9GAMM|nr:aminodeoxychorismate lyase [Reinekea thalattae]TXR53514.1 aminodeoxychorismate lyase [Reinekea thalattae]